MQNAGLCVGGWSLPPLKYPVPQVTRSLWVPGWALSSALLVLILSPVAKPAMRKTGPTDHLDFFHFDFSLQLKNAKLLVAH